MLLRPGTPEFAAFAALQSRRRRAAEAPVGEVLSPAIDWAGLPARYRAAAPAILVLDDVLTTEALAALRRDCLGSQMWSKTYASGYLSAVLGAGFHSLTLLRLAKALEERLALPVDPAARLAQAWAFKCDSRMAGTAVHADFAALNVNVWIAPPGANLDPEGGGLRLYDVPRPPGWDFADYNADPARIRAYLAEKNARAIDVPHRTNRAVIFDSRLFHETQPIHFRPEYENRRVNITLLFGRSA